MIDPTTEVQNIINQLDSDNIPEQGRLLMLLPVAVYICDAEGYIKNYNTAAAKVWGREPELGKEKWSGAFKLFYSDNTPMPLDECPMAVAIKGGTRVKNAEIIVERPDGTRSCISPDPIPFNDKNGKIAGAVSVMTDITDAKNNERTLAHMAAIIQNSDDAIISKNLDGIITSWNAGAERIFGYTADEMIGRHILTLIPESRKDEEPRIIERLKRGERVDHFETQRVTKDGRLLDISLTISPIKDKHGNVVGASKIARDITAQKQIAKVASEAEERFRMAVASTGLGTWEYYPQTGDLSWSEECRRIYDIAPGTPVSMDLFSKYIHPEDADMTQQAIEAAMNPDGDGSYDIQFRVLRVSDQKPRWIRSQGKVYFNNDRQPERFIGTVLDITEDKAAREALAQMVMKRTEELNNANLDLARTNSELEQFAYVASHDLQEPLRKIQTFADRLHLKGKDVLNEELNNYIDRIVHSAGKMSVLIKNLLNYARIGRMAQEYVKVDLNDTLASVLDDLDIIIQQKKAQVNVSSLPQIEAIPLQMGQLFYNLLNNSLKFAADERKPEINITSRTLSTDEKQEHHLEAGKAYYQIEFEDNGIGFSPEYSERIFTIFQRLNSKEIYPGTGIGLALCKKVADNHNGLIYASGEPGKGAKFTIILPATQ
jgi:PAS domain S-box-containing protein